MRFAEHQLREEFETWLSDETWDWTTYATLTFARPMLKDALRFAKVWVRNIARTASGVSGFCFQETHSDGQRLHVHCLLSVRPNLLSQPSNKDMWFLWFRSFGRALILDYDPSWTRGESLTMKRAREKGSRGIARLATYLTKYLLKEGSTGGFDWDYYSYQDGKELDMVQTVVYKKQLAGFEWSPGDVHNGILQ